jgi:endonuclease YncB( thermonuclease family)
MTITEILWMPAGQELDGFDRLRFVDITDGDTPNVRMPVRMLSIDTPERTAQSATGAARVDEQFAQLVGWISEGRAPVGPALAEHLLPRLAGGGTRQLTQAGEASAELTRITDERLRRADGSRRNLFMRLADERIDRYGRLLAYIAPDYTAAERAIMTREQRRTFNLDMLSSGWAAPFVIHPSIPGELDLPILIGTAEDAINARRGQWGDDLSLLGYEYRMVERLHDVTRDLVAGQQVTAQRRFSWRERYCADMRDRAVYLPEDYIRVPPAYRLFIWPDRLREAIAQLNLRPRLGD